MLRGTAAWWNFLLGRSDQPGHQNNAVSPPRLRRSSRFPLQRMKLQDKIKDFPPGSPGRSSDPSLRMAERRFRGLLAQEPPRATRLRQRPVVREPIARVANLPLFQQAFVHFQTLPWTL